MAGGTSRQAHGRRPERIVGCRHQHFIACIKQRLHGHDDQLGYAIAGDDVVQLYAGNRLGLRVLHDGLTRSKQAAGIGVARRPRQVDHHITNHLLGRFKPEGRQIADVQLDDAMPFFLERPGSRHDGATDVVADVGKLRRFLDSLHRPWGLARARTRAHGFFAG